MKQFVVIGLSPFGKGLAVALASMNHQVLVVDIDKKKVEQISDVVTQAIIADARDRKVLTEFVDRTVDAVILGLRRNMEAGILASLYLKDLGVRDIIAEAVSEDHGRVLRAVGANQIVFPEKDIAVRLAERLSTPNLIEHIPLTPEYSVVEIATPSDFVGKSLGELQLRSKLGIEVIAVKNMVSDCFDLIPGGEYVLGRDTALIVIGKESGIHELKAIT